VDYQPGSGEASTNGGEAGARRGEAGAGRSRGSVDRRVERGRTTRDRLIAAARELFGAHGYEDTSIGAILEAGGVARGALYHHFATKEALFDAVLDRTVAEIAASVAEAARAQAADPVESLRAGCHEWLRLAVDPAVQRIALVDAPAVLGWSRWREIDERHTLGGVKAGLARIKAEGRLPAGDADVLAHMLMAAVNEAALMVARADDPEAGLAAGLESVDTLLDRLFGEP
jgi:AcrR family transcriptional regulator